MINVFPTYDLKPHTLNTTCECSPRVLLENGEMIVVHSSFDGREALEEANEILDRLNKPNN